MRLHYLPGTAALQRFGENGAQLRYRRGR